MSHGHDGRRVVWMGLDTSEPGPLVVPVNPPLEVGEVEIDVDITPTGDFVRNWDDGETVRAEMADPAALRRRTREMSITELTTAIMASESETTKE